MGSGRDKRKKAKGNVPGQGADKTAKKTEKNEEKQQRRLERKAKASCQTRRRDSLALLLIFSAVSPKF